ncbi:MAG: Mitochondrial distribution and morphology protein 31, mitochondrial precursor [Pleopsidium flavum]|nr:MAG: Mitochondrial distribution and morphology protein 31, mitochondrial precursor [Pleopsidium flavum]
MSGNVGGRLLATIYRSTNPIYGAAFRSTTTALFQEISQKAFSPSRSTTARSFPPKSPKHAISRSFASAGFVAIGTNSSSPAAETVASKWANAVEKRRSSGSSTLDRRKATYQLGVARQRAIHSSSRWGSFGDSKRNRNSKSGSHGMEDGREGTAGPKDSVTSKASQRAAKGLAAASAVNKHVMDRLPNMPHLHRPNKEELLAAATGFWSRLKVRFKWFSIRSVRPFNMDEIGAFFSWFVLGHVIWIIVGTTTFFSLAIFAVNTVFAQETLARWVGNYLTKSSGIKVVFESAIVPKWGDGVITFKNVFVSRRPGQGKAKVSKGSSTTAAAVAAATAAADRARESGEPQRTMDIGAEEEEDTNYTQFDLSIDTVNVTLSFAKWFNSKGLLRDVEVKGIRGVVDRTSVHYSGEYVDPRVYKHEHNPGDFEINSFKMEDLLVTIHQPHNFRPFSISIFSCDLPQLRRQWLFYDFLSANMMSGSLDDSLFTIHPRQIHGYSGAQLDSGAGFGEAQPWKKQSRLRIDGLNIDHLNRGVEGPFSWIHEGKVDIVADLMFPADNDESIAKVMSDFYDRMEATVTSNRQSSAEKVDVNVISHDSTNTSVPAADTNSEDDKRFLVMDLRIHLNGVRAAVPLFTKDISYVRNALIRPIVAYINSRRTFIPINCRVVKRASEFDGSWTIFDSGLMDDLSAETYEAFARDVVDEQARRRRFKKVGLWSLQLAVQALFIGMAGNIA